MDTSVMDMADMVRTQQNFRMAVRKRRVGGEKEKDRYKS